MTSAEQLTYSPAAAVPLLSPGRLEELKPALISARDRVLSDVETWQAGITPPVEDIPLDAGFIQWPEELLHNLRNDGVQSQVARIEACGQRLREAVDNIVVLGIGGSYMGMRALFEALLHPLHNELQRDERNGIPRLYFEGWNVDTDHQKALLDLLKSRAASARTDRPEGRTAVIVISKSGGTFETAVAFRTFRNFIEETFPGQAQDLIVPVTGERGKLRDLSDAAGFRDIFSIPEGIGGRFSVLTAVGLLPAAAVGIDIRQLLQGAADMTDVFRTAGCGSNPVLDYTGVCHAFETDHGMNERVLSTWGCRLEAIGFWYDQLLSESLGKHERGATPLTVVNTRDLHSRGQQHQEGTRNKLITNLLPGASCETPLAIPQRDDDFDGLNRYAGRTLSEVLQAAVDGTNEAYRDDRRPTADICLPGVSAHSVGQLFQMLMLATVTEGRLTGINPYGQPGVEAYKKNMVRILSGAADSA